MSNEQDLDNDFRNKLKDEIRMIYLDSISPQY